MIRCVAADNDYKSLHLVCWVTTDKNIKFITQDIVCDGVLQI